jgi:hypothetical protein
MFFLLSINWLWLKIAIFTPVYLFGYVSHTLGWVGWAIALLFLAWCMNEDK